VAGALARRPFKKSFGHFLGDICASDKFALGDQVKTANGGPEAPSGTARNSAM
jgi:hypothetical protein